MSKRTRVGTAVLLCCITVAAAALTAVPLPYQVFASAADDARPYTGKIFHIFFHSLILDTRLAFKSANSEGYNYWMTTRDELLRILDKLYKNDYILVDIDYVKQSKLKGCLMLPEGKKPLVISLDDVNYYDYMKGEGFADRLTVDGGGELAAVVVAGEEYIDYIGDAVPIVERFVRAHPDFSYQGAKGIVAVTGFQGVFGYRTYPLADKRDKPETLMAKRVADALKAKGWRIACHSFSHSKSFRDGSISFERLKADTEKWKTEIAPITGDTNIYISPFGIQLPPNERRFKYLAANGFDIYCSVAKGMNVSFSRGVMICERLNFDGFTMLKYPSRITSGFFEIDDIIDSSRPTIN